MTADFLMAGRLMNRADGCIIGRIVVLVEKT
jgi:hypothetical protein